MKILFLDIDGVLVNRKRLIAGKPYEFDESCKERLETFLTQYPDVKIVLSSTWRRTDRTMNFINHNSRLIYRRIISKTPVLQGVDDIRGREIETWLDLYYKPITHYAILDDDSDMLPEQMEYFVHVNNNFEGVQDNHIEKLKKILEL
jgi:transcriptional antiterminator